MILNDQQQLNQLIKLQNDNSNAEVLYLNKTYHNRSIDNDHQTQTLESYTKQLESSKNLDKFQKVLYNTFQMKDDSVQMVKKNLLPFVQYELKTHMLHQQLDNDEKKDQFVSQDLPLCFLKVIEHLRLLLTRTKGQINVKKIQDLKIPLARLELTSQADKQYIIQASHITLENNQRYKHQDDIKKELDICNLQNLSNINKAEKIASNQRIYNLLTDEERVTLIKEKILKPNENQKQKEKDKSCQEFDILTIQEINRCFYNDQYLSKIYIFTTCLNRMLQGDFNFLELLYIEEDNTPLTIHPCVLGTRLYFEDRLTEVKGDHEKKVYQKVSSLPTVVFINLDGFDHPLNTEIIKKYTSFKYFSIFHEFFNPDGPFSFYKFLQKNPETLKSFFPFYLPFYKHIEEYYQEKAKKRSYSEQEKQDFTNEKLDGLFRGVITEEEFAYIFEEYILNRINELTKVDLVIVSYSCVMSPFNTRTNKIFQLSEDVFFNIFTHLARRTNFRMLFVPRLIINTYIKEKGINNQIKYFQAKNSNKSFQEIENKIILPAALMNRDQIQLKKYESGINNKFTYEQMKNELSRYEEEVREVFGTIQIKENIEENKIRYTYEIPELIKYIQNISCGFFQYFNSLNTIAQRSNNSVFTQKKNTLDWRYVESITFMAKRQHKFKDDDELQEKKHQLGYFKKDYKYFVEVLKNKENFKIESFSNTKSLNYQRELANVLEYTDVIFLMKVNKQKKATDPNPNKEIVEDNEMKVKKYKIINSLSKPCFLTKYSQYYVDYKYQIVYFFNILFSRIDRTDNNLSQTMANCIGHIPEDPKDDEIQIQKICDWQFSRITLGQRYLLQDQRQFFLQDATISSCSWLLKDNKDKIQLLIFFGGKFNFYDNQKSEININDDLMFKNQNLYILKIENKSIFSFKEVKIFGEQETIQNLSYSSGSSIGYGNTGLRENYLFIFGGQYDSDHGECSLQNLILYSSMTQVLNDIVQEKDQKDQNIKTGIDDNSQTNKTNKVQNNIETSSKAVTEKTGTGQAQTQPVQAPTQTKTNFNFNNFKFQYNESKKDDFKELIAYLENIDEHKEIKDKVQLQQINIYLRQLCGIQKIADMFINEPKQLVYYNYAKFLCLKILKKYSEAFELLLKEQALTHQTLLKELCVLNPVKTVYYFSHYIKCNKNEQIEFFTAFFNKMTETFSFPDDKKKQYIQDVIYYACIFNPNKYTNDEKLKVLENQIEERLRAQRTKTNDEIKILANIYLQLSKIHSQMQNEKRIDSYRQALKYFEMLTDTPVKNKTAFYYTHFKQIPKQSVSYSISFNLTFQH